jgi:hypothetical protein
MYSKSIPASTITSTILNSLTGYVADPSLTFNAIINKGSVTPNNGEVKYPKGLQIINKSGTDLEYLIFSTQDEIDMYASIANYPYFSFILLPNNTTLSNSSLPLCKQFVVRSVGGSGATSGIRIDFFGY